MYSTKPNNRGYTVYKDYNDISSLEKPLIELAKAHVALRRHDSEAYEEARIGYKNYLIAKAEELHNATSEGSLESYDNIGIEEAVEAKFPAKQALGKAGLEAEAELMEEFAKTYGIINKASWFFPQMLAKISKEVYPVLNEAGTHYSTLALAKSMKSTPELYALLQIAIFPKRSIFMKSQTSAELKNYSSLVPLVLAAFKQYQKIPYSKWDKEALHLVVDPNLTKAMLVTELPEITREEVLADREDALRVKTGPKAGQLRPAETTYTMYFSRESQLYELPVLAKIMMCQTWCAHPNTRSTQMVLNPLQWDEVPVALVNTTVVPKPTYTFKRAVAIDDVPWAN